MGKELILAYDLGTTGAKTTIFATDGAIVASDYHPYPTYHPGPGWTEQDPEDWWGAIVSTTRGMLSKSNVNPADIAAIGFSGHMMGCLPIDSEGIPLRRSLLHSDVRSAAQAEHIAGVVGTEVVYRITGNLPDPHYPASKMAWIKETEPDIYERTAMFLQCKDYIAGRLTGSFRCSDLSDVSLSGLFDLRVRQWSDEMIEAAGISRGKLPEVCESSTIVGKVTHEAAGATGLVEGTPVVIGGGDGACATVGAGATEPGDAYNYIGSSSWVSAVSLQPGLDPEMRVFTLCDLDPNKYNILGTVQCAGGAYEWFADNLGTLEKEQEKQTGVSRFEMLDRLARGVAPGSNGLIFLPYLLGERAPIWDSNARGVYFGLGQEHTRAHMARAVLEGVGFALRSVLDVMTELDISASSVRVIGGGAQGQLWREILASIYNRPVLAPECLREATSYGAAIAAGIGVGLYEDYSVARSIVKIKDEHKPDPRVARTYDKVYAIYRSLYPSLKEQFAQLAALRQEGL